MSDACGCGDDEPRTGEASEEHEPERLWEITELRAAAVAGVLLLAGYVVGWTDGPPSSSWRCECAGPADRRLRRSCPPRCKRLAKGKIGVGTLMTIAAVGAVILGEVGEAAMLAFLFSISEGLEEYSLARTRRGLRALLSLVPERPPSCATAPKSSVAPAELRVGDRMLVRPGERIATDGIIRAGRTALDVSAITGESVPVEAGPGDEVFAGSINGTGVLEVEVTATAEDNSLARIVRIVEAEQSRKGASQRLADRIAKPLVPGDHDRRRAHRRHRQPARRPADRGSNAPWSCWSPPRRARWRSRCRSPWSPRSARPASSACWSRAAPHWKRSARSAPSRWTRPAR